LDDQIDYPLTDLDLSPYVLSAKNGLGEDVSLQYDLYAVSNHYGSLSFGHYTAYCKNPETGIWYDFNDSSVSRLTSDQDAISNSAYVLYYMRKDFFPSKDYDFASIKVALEGDTNTVAHMKLIGLQQTII
jgi:ubiquitin carboxyl-terminal hydrolase 4/11